MGKQLLLAVDVGTSSCVVTTFDFSGNVVHSWTGDYKTYHPASGYAQQRAEDWWEVICQGINVLINKQGLKPEQVCAIGVDGTSWACLPVDKQGIPLRPAMLWLDRRATKQASRMKEIIGEKQLWEINGNPVDPAYIVPKMLWLKEKEPDVYKRTYRFLQSNGYIVYQFTGQYSQDYSQGYGFHFFDISTGNWRQDIAMELELSLDLLPPLFHSHQVVGKVTPKAARETSLLVGIPVVAGGLDAACCALGAGVVQPGQTQEQGGQAGGMSIQVEQPLMHPKLILGYHVIPDQWLLQGGTVGGGGALRWFNEQLGGFEQQSAKELDVSPYELMDDAAENIGPGSEGLVFLPYMAGERSPIWDSKARGVFFGLSYEKTRAHVIRSIMEGVGYSLQHNLKTAEEIGIKVDVLRSVGGAANSHLWTQIKADITGKVIQVPLADNATCLGAAILAGVGIGVYNDFSEAVEKTVHIQRTHHPNQENGEVYGRYYQLYLKLYENLKDLYEKLAQI